MPAGYSGTPLAQKLGIKPGMKLLVLGSPWDYRKTVAIPQGVVLQRGRTARLEFVHLFVRTRKELETRFGALAKALDDRGSIWVSWPKKAAGTATDLNENVVRDLGLASGVVDVKVCAVDEVWSGLKFVRRLRDRAISHKP